MNHSRACLKCNNWKSLRFCILCEQHDINPDSQIAFNISWISVLARLLSEYVCSVHSFDAPSSNTEQVSVQVCECGRVCKNLRGLRIHKVNFCFLRPAAVIAMHPGLRKHSSKNEDPKRLGLQHCVCPFCEKEFQWFDSLVRHISKKKM